MSESEAITSNTQDTTMDTAEKSTSDEPTTAPEAKKKRGRKPKVVADTPAKELTEKRERKKTNKYTDTVKLSGVKKKTSKKKAKKGEKPAAKTEAPKKKGRAKGSKNKPKETSQEIEPAKA